MSKFSFYPKESDNNSRLFLNDWADESREKWRDWNFSFQAIEELVSIRHVVPMHPFTKFRQRFWICAEED